jgi:competence protein ComEA
MPELTPRQLLLCGLALLALAVFAVVYAGRDDGVAAAPRAPSLEVRGADEGGSALVVHVAGAVRQPGVYRLRAGARVSDAVERAGGARRRADLGAVNLAAELQDGRQVLVPLRLKGGGAAVAAAGGVPPGVPLDLNTATVEQLDELDGIGPATAQQIVAYREAHGGFGSVEELDQVPGIGETRLAALRDKVRV